MIPYVLEVLRRIRYFFQRDRLEAELREEMETHLDMLAKEHDATYARQRIGNLTRWQEVSREVWGWNWLESLARDIGYGGRLLARSPGFTLTACLSLAIGIGATMGVFSLMNALLFKALPVPEPGQLWQLSHNTPAERDDNFSYPMFAALQRANSSGIPLFAAGGDYVQANFGSSVRNIPALIVSGDALQILGLTADAGRLLNNSDDLRGIPQGANCMLSYRLWQSEFRGDPAAVGKHFTIGAQSFTIVGVAPPSFFGVYVGSYSDLILPIAAYAATNPAQPILNNAGWTWLRIIARVPPHMPIPQLTARLNAVYPAIRRELEPSPAEAPKPDRLYMESVATGVSAIRERFSKPLYVLLTMTGLVLMIACANLANLLLTRSVVRHRELAIRLSIGAKRGRIVRQLLTENALTLALGASASVPVYLACTRGLVAFLRSGWDSNIFLNTNPDWRFVLGTLALLSLTLLLFGFAPAVGAAHSDLNTALNETSRRFAAKASFAKAVVAVQISLSLVLLLGAALLSRSLYDLRTFNPGFRRDHLLIADIDTSQSIHKNSDLVQFFNDLLERVHALPGVRSAAASVVAPLMGRSWQQDYEIRDATRAGSVQHSFENWITPGYFETLGTSLMLGRNVGQSDSAASPHVAVINEAFARRAFRLSDPLGHQIYERAKKDLITIVGVVSDSRYRSLRDEAPPTVYRPIAQLPPAFGFLLTLNLEVWTSTPPSTVANPIDRLVKHLDSQATVDFRVFDELIDSDLLYERLLTALSVAFGIVGLLLSAIGVYGLSAYSVVRRTSEVGIRIAMGATPNSILRLILSEHFRLLAFGVSAGSLLSIALTRFLHAWLFGVSATDPLLFSSALVFVSALALIAAFVPARRAAHLNPTTALRCE